MYTKISETAKYIPKGILTNDDLSKFVDTSDEWIKKRTGISTRHIVFKENEEFMATEVAKTILQKSNINSSDIDLIITSSMSPDSTSPTASALIQRNIGANNAAGFDINSACTGFVYALSIGDKYIKAGVAKNVLVIASEQNSKFIDWNDRSTCVLFGDGAGGVLLQATKDKNENSFLYEDMYVSGSNDIESGKIEDIEDKLSSSNEKISISPLKMNGKNVFEFVAMKVPNSIDKVLKMASLEVSDIDQFILHQANYRLLELISKKKKIRPDKMFSNIEKYGNTSSASVAIALDEYLKNKDKDKVNILMSAFGGGLSIGTCLLRIGE